MLLALSNPSDGDQAKRFTPNLLPCQVNHSGPVTISPRYWNPQSDEHMISSSPNTKLETERLGEWAGSVEDGPTDRSVAYMRGRRLVSRRVRLPEGYTGIVAQRTETRLPAIPSTLRHCASERQKDHQAVSRGWLPDTGKGEEEVDGYNGQLGEEDDEELVEAKLMQQVGTFNEMLVWGHESVPERNDPYVRAINEWIGMAQKLHDFDEPGQ